MTGTRKPVLPLRCAASLIYTALPVLIGCSERGPTMPSAKQLSTLIVVSAPVGPWGSVARVARSVARLATSATALGEESIVYVSMPPGRVPAGETATVRNLATGQALTVTMVNGGFDPAPVAATVGDTLEVDVTVPTGSDRYFAVVPRRRPPSLVRTDPPKGKIDVPLNTQILIVFSDPIDPATLPGAVRLLNGSTAITGTVTLSTSGLIASFAPDPLLAPTTSYQLVIDTTLRNSRGDAPDSTVHVTFTTGTRTGAGLIAFQSSIGIETINPDGSGRRVLIADTTAFEPAWSPDGTKLAFTRTADGWKNCGIYTARADGSRVQRVTKFVDGTSWCARSPAWAPDGLYIAFSADSGGGCPNSECTGQSIWVAAADGSWQEQVFTAASLPPITQYPMFYYTLGRPTWSPDRTKLAFECNAEAYSAPSPDSFVGVCAGNLAVARGSPLRLAQRLVECCPQAPAWSPDGLAIAFQEYGPGGIGLMNPDGTNSRDLLLSSRVVLFSVPAWSPDGSQLVYIGGEGQFLQPTFPADYPWGDLHVMNRDGTNSRRLTTTGGLNYPSWASSSPALSARRGKLPRATGTSSQSGPKP